MELAGYRLTDPIGAGASADVWAATAPDGSDAVVKVLAATGAAGLRDARREQALVAQLDHRHIAEVLDVVTDGHQVGLVLPPAQASLAAWLEENGPLDDRAVLRLAVQLAGALAAAHERGIVHADVSAGNVLVDGTGGYLLADWGSALSRPDAVARAATPATAAPELAKAGTASAAGDVFSLAALALWAATGRPAWNADSLSDVVIQATVGQWPTPPDGMNPALSTWLTAALSEEPSERPSAAATIADLRGVHADLGSPDATRADPAAAGERSAHERLALIRTRVRADAPAPLAEPAPVTAGWRQKLRRFSPHAAARKHAAATKHPAATKWLPVLACAVLGVVAAVIVGTHWGSGSGPAPAVLPVASSPGSPVATQSTARTPATNPAASQMPTASTTGPATQPATTRTATARPATAPPATTLPPTRPPTTMIDWQPIIEDLDRARSVALVRRDPAGLDAVYTADAPARRADERTIAALKQRGWAVSGAAHRIVDVRIVAVHGRVVRVLVTDSLPTYRLLDARGAEVGRTPAAPRRTRAFELVEHQDDYRIRAITTA